MEKKKPFKIEKNVNLNYDTLLKTGQSLLKKSTIQLQHNLQSHFSLSFPFFEMKSHCVALASLQVTTLCKPGWS